MYDTFLAFLIYLCMNLSNILYFDILVIKLQLNVYSGSQISI